MGGLRGGAGLGDHVDGEIPVSDDVQEVRDIAGAQVVPGKVDFHAPACVQLVAERTLDKLQARPGAQVAAADADGNQHLALGLDTLGGGFYPGELFPVIGVGPVSYTHLTLPTKA